MFSRRMAQRLLTTLLPVATLVVFASALVAAVHVLALEHIEPGKDAVLALVLLCWAAREALMINASCSGSVAPSSNAEDSSPLRTASRSISRGESWRSAFVEDSLTVYHSLFALEKESTERGKSRAQGAGRRDRWLSMRVLHDTATTIANLSAQYRAHALAHRFHAKADFVNVGVQALLFECDKELGSILRSPRPGRQTLLPRYKHIDVAIDELLTIQHMVSANQAAQLQAALIAPQQQLKLKLAQLKALPDDAPFMTRLNAALKARSLQGTCNPHTMIEHLATANDE
eukprot:7156677-Prymnesium_polylepis.1